MFLSFYSSRYNIMVDYLCPSSSHQEDIWMFIDQFFQLLPLILTCTSSGGERSWALVWSIPFIFPAPCSWSTKPVHNECWGPAWWLGTCGKQLRQAPEENTMEDWSISQTYGTYGRRRFHSWHPLPSLGSVPPSHLLCLSVKNKGLYIPWHIHLCFSPTEQWLGGTLYFITILNPIHSAHCHPCHAYGITTTTSSQTQTINCYILTILDTIYRHEKIMFQYKNKNIQFWSCNFVCKLTSSLCTNAK